MLNTLSLRRLSVSVFYTYFSHLNLWKQRTLRWQDFRWTAACAPEFLLKECQTGSLLPVLEGNVGENQPFLCLSIKVRGLLWWLSREESACNARDVGLIPGSGRPSGEGTGNPLQYSCLGNLMDRGAWGLQFDLT